MPISLLQAKTLALASVPVAPVKRVTLNEAAGRFLADGISAQRPEPHEDVAAIDGWAVAAIDLRTARAEHAVKLDAVTISVAGELRSGQAVRVAAGDTVPFGADAVLPLEAARQEGARVSALNAPHAGQYVLKRGEEWSKSELIYPAGARVDATALGVLASLGISDVAVRPLTRVALLEVDVKQPMLPMLRSLVRDLGTEVVAAEHCTIREDAIASALEVCLHRAELLVVSPSLSALPAVTGVIKRLGGTIGFEHVLVKPGRHASVAVLRDKPIAVLPGPPLATLAAFEQLARPMLLKRHGVVEKRPRRKVRLDMPLKKRTGRVLLVPARLEQRAAVLFASFRAPGGRYLGGAVGADGWLIFPEEQGDCGVGDEAELELNSMSVFTGLPTNPHDEATR